MKASMKDRRSVWRRLHNQ